MRWRQGVVAFFLGGIASAAAGHAQELSTPNPTAQYIDERVGMSVAVAIARALLHEPSLRAVRADLEVARAQRHQAELRLNPMLSVEHRGEPGGSDALTTIGVEWQLDLDRRSGRTQTADQSVAVAQFIAADRERVLATDVRTRYGAAVAAVRELALAEELLTAAARQLNLVRARAEAGSTPPLDRDLLDVEVRRLDAARLIAIGRVEVAFVDLKQRLGMAPTDLLQLRDSLDSLIAAITTDPADVAGMTASVRSDVLEAEARVGLADARVDQAHREGRADVTLFGNYMRMDSSFPQLGIGEAGALERIRGRFNYVAAGATVSLPALNRNQGQVAAAQAERLGAVARRDAINLAVRAEVAAAQARDRYAQLAVQIYGGGVRSLARRNLDVVRQTFDLGRATIFDVLAEQRRWVEIEQGYTAAAREAWEARVALTSARGEPR
jgi:cobalt-zinc-cadmium efflux system outer membrane protein